MPNMHSDDDGSVIKRPASPDALKPATRKSPRRPASREALRIPTRDEAVLRFLGEVGEAAAGVVRRAFFHGDSATPLYRSIRRLRSRGLLATHREHAFAEVRLRLTARGVHMLIDRGDSEEQIFRLVRPAAREEWPHRDAVGRLMVALRRLTPPPALLVPYWSLQRRLEPRPTVVPDLMAIWKPQDEQAGAALIVEVDFGGESLTRVLKPKLDVLARFVGDLGSEATTILILLNRLSRLRAVERLLGESTAFSSIRLALLPNRQDDDRLDELHSGVRWRCAERCTPRKLSSH